MEKQNDAPARTNQALFTLKSLRKHGKQDIGTRPEVLLGGRSVAHKLHFLVAGRVPRYAVC